MLEIDEPIRGPYSYNSIEEELVGNEDEIANSEDNLANYAKKLAITQNGKLNDGERDLDMAKDAKKKTDMVDKDEDTNDESKAEETDEDMETVYDECDED